MSHPFGRPIPLDDRDHRDLIVTRKFDAEQICQIYSVPQDRLGVDRPGLVHWAAFWAIAVCGGPMIALMAGYALHGAARSLGWVP